MSDEKFIIYTREDSGRVVTLDEISGRGLQFQPGEVLNVGEGNQYDVSEEFAARHVEVGNCKYCDREGNVIKLVEKVEDSKPVETITKPTVASSLVQSFSPQIAVEPATSTEP